MILNTCLLLFADNSTHGTFFYTSKRNNFFFIYMRAIKAYSFTLCESIETIWFFFKRHHLFYSLALSLSLVYFFLLSGFASFSFRFFFSLYVPFLFFSAVDWFGFVLIGTFLSPYFGFQRETIELFYSVFHKTLYHLKCFPCYLHLDFQLIRWRLFVCL